MAINTTREKYFFQFISETPPADFKHEPAASKPTVPTWPGTLTANEQQRVRDWRVGHLDYASLNATEQSKADEFITYDKLKHAWMSADNAARHTQWAWFRADAAISNYDAVPQSGSNSGTGSGAPVTPQTKQEP